MNDRSCIRDPGFAKATLLKAREVADLLGIHERTVWRMVSAGTLPEPIRVGDRSVRWRLVDIEAFVAAAPSCCHVVRESSTGR